MTKELTRLHMECVLTEIMARKWLIEMQRKEIQWEQLELFDGYQLTQAQLQPSAMTDQPKGSMCSFSMVDNTATRESGITASASSGMHLQLVNTTTMQSDHERTNLQHESP